MLGSYTTTRTDTTKRDETIGDELATCCCLGTRDGPFVIHPVTDESQHALELKATTANTSSPPNISRSTPSPPDRPPRFVENTPPAGLRVLTRMPV